MKKLSYLKIHNRYHGGIEEYTQTEKWGIEVKVNNEPTHHNAVLTMEEILHVVETREAFTILEMR